MPSIGHSRVQAVANEVIHLVDIDGAGKHAGKNSRCGDARLLAQQGHHIARLHVPVVAQYVANLSLQQKAIRKQLMAWDAGQFDVFNRVAKRPVAQVVEESCRQKNLGVLRADCRLKPLIVCKPPQVEQCKSKNAQAMLEARMVGRRINERYQSQLADACQAAEIGRINDLLHTARQRNVDLRRYAEERPPRIQRDHFRNIENF